LEIDLKRKQGSFAIDAVFKGARSGVTALFGSSGAGKTSIVNMVAGLLKPDAGRVAVNGHVMFDSARRINLSPEKRRIGYVFQDGRLLPHFTVKSNLMYGMHRTPPEQRYINFDQVVELLGIVHLLQRRPAKLSGGEKQRVAIGRALLTSPALLLMDEPLASLDTDRKNEVLPFIMRMSREFSIPILYVTHAMDEIFNLASHMVLLESGRTVASGPIEHLMSRPDLRSHFGNEDYGVVIETKVVALKDSDGLMGLRFPGGVLKARSLNALPSSSVRVRIPARSVAIALEKPIQSSFQNVFPCVVTQVINDGGAFAHVGLDMGCPIMAQITRKSCKELNLVSGQPVFAVIKSIALSPWKTT
jgi:molybdate transport system ATP-binding protein